MIKHLSVGLLLCLIPLASLADIWPSDLDPTGDESSVLSIHTHPGDAVSVSRKELEAIGLYDAEFEHFEGLSGRFTGVLLNDFLTAYDLADIDRIRLLAADGYTTFLSREERAETTYLLVTRFDDEPLTVEQLGPLMLVAPEQADEVLAGTAPMTRWIWSVTDIQALQ